MKCDEEYKMRLASAVVKVQLDIAREMLARNYPIEDIVAITKLPKEIVLA